MDEIAVPGILAYKGADCFANLVSIVNEIPSGKEFSVSTLELMLQQYVLATDHLLSPNYAHRYLGTRSCYKCPMPL